MIVPFPIEINRLSKEWWEQERDFAQYQIQFVCQHFQLFDEHAQELYLHAAYREEAVNAFKEFVA